MGRGVSVGCGAVSKLPFVVGSESVQGAIGFENQGVAVSCGDLSDPGGENLRGGRAVGGGAVAKLPLGIVSESVQGAIGFENQGVIFSCVDLSDAGRKDLCGGRAVGGGAVAQLAVLITSKSMQRPIGLENEGEGLAKQGGADEQGENENHPIPKQAQPRQGMGFVSQAAHLGFELICNARGAREI